MLGLRFHAGMSGTSAARRIFEILDIEEQGPDKREERAENRQPDARDPLLFSTLHLSALSYTYPGEAEPALTDITLEIHAGEHIALVGSSGAGKSTLAALLLRLIEPGAGHLSLNGEPSTEIPLETWRRLVAWVPQTPSLFHDTLAANLRLAKPEASPVELMEAARQAHLEQFIQALPDGYETRIGEEGARLSMGQAQRLALARALLKMLPS